MNTDTDLMDAYFELMIPSSECPLIYHRWCLISAVGALLGRKCWLDFGFDKIYPNMYTCILGTAGSRKSSAIKAARKLLEAVDYNYFARERTSKEKFLKDLGAGFDTINGGIPHEGIDADTILLQGGDFIETTAGPSEVYINAGELEDFMGQGDVTFISLLTNLWDNLDRYSHGKMTSQDIYINEPTINLMGGCTPTTFNSVFPPEVIGQGMLSRMLLIFGGGNRTKITFPPPLDKEKLSDIIEILAGIRDTISGAMTLEPAAMKLLDDIYQTSYTIADARFDNYINRRHIHLLKLCMIIAAMDLSTTITSAHLIKANSILFHAESLMPRALGEFGMAKNSDAVNIVSQFITEAYYKSNTGVTAKEIFEATSNHFVSFSKDFTECLQKLSRSGKMKCISGKWIPIQATSHVKLPHVYVESLLEYQDTKEK